MDAPLSGKQKRESMKFLLDQLRDTAAFRKEQRRKDTSANQQLNHKEQKHQAKMAEMSVPPMMGRPTNPEAGPNDKIPALLAPGEAVIPAKSAQKPENKPLIKAMVREGRSDRNLSVPKMGFECGTSMVKGYEDGDTYVSNDNSYNADYQNEMDLQSDWYSTPQVEQQIAQDRALIKQEGINAIKPLAAVADVVGTPINALAKGGSWLANAVGIPRAGRALGIYDKDVTSVEIPTIGNGSITPFYDMTRQATEENQKKLVAPVPVSEKVRPALPPEKSEIISALNKYGASGDVPALSTEEAKGYFGEPVITPEESKGYFGKEVVPEPTAAKETLTAIEIPKDKSGFTKWSDAISGAIKGTYDSISDPEKLKGALGGALETLGFNGRDASRFAMLVAGSKALGYDTTQAVRHAGMYTLKASDQRASDERSYEKAMSVEAQKQRSAHIRAGGKIGSKGELLAGDWKPTSKIERVTLSTGITRGEPIAFEERKQGGTGEVALFHPTMKSPVDPSRNMTYQEYQKYVAKDNTLVPYSGSTDKNALAASYDTSIKMMNDNYDNFINNEFQGPMGDKNSYRKKYQEAIPDRTKVSMALVNAVKDSGEDVRDPGVRHEINNLQDKVQTMIAADVKAGTFKKADDLTPYVRKAMLISQPGVSESLFITEKNSQMTPNLISKQFDQVKHLVSSDKEVKTDADKHSATSKRYIKYAQDYQKLKNDPAAAKLLPLNQPDQSSFFVFVNKAIAAELQAKNK